MQAGTHLPRSIYYCVQLPLLSGVVYIEIHPGCSQAGGSWDGNSVFVILPLCPHTSTCPQVGEYELLKRRKHKGMQNSKGASALLA